MTLKVIGAGFGRTGTLSMQRALNELGLGPTYHMNDVFQNRSHVQRWLDYAETRTEDWDDFFAKYQATVDYPACCAWESLYEEYPDAKVVLTVRDSASWWKSTAEVIYPARTMWAGWLTRMVPFTQRWLDMVDAMVWDGTFDGRFEDQAHAIKVFEEHIEYVKARCDPERLLVFQVSEGWQPLCDFLGVPVPDKPFPHLNDAKSLKRRFAFMRWGTRAAPYALVAAVAATALRRRSN